MNLLDSALDHSPRKTSSRHWSSYQQAIFQAVEEGSQNLLVQAVAGSGKSTTLVEAMEHSQGRNLFLAFNKSIAMDIAAKAPEQTVKTLNALGHWQWMQNSPGSKLEARKVSLIIKRLIGEGEDYKEFGYTLTRLVGLAKNLCFGLDQGPGSGFKTSFPPTIFQVDPQLFEDLVEAYHFDLPLEQLPRFCEVCSLALYESSSDWETFDFDDQLYMPALAGWDYPSYSTVFVDECQDLSPIQHLMLDRLALKGARIIAVGDRHQAIYGFRGAATNSMELLKHRFSALELPLSISYRCDNAIISEAQIYCPTILARSDAGPGLVTLQDGEDPALFNSGLVVCRNNAPLFAAILRHYRAKRPCRVLSNFLESFTGFLRGFKTTYSSDLQSKLDLWYHRECESARSKGQRGRLAGLEDKYETASLFCRDFQLTADILLCIKRLGEGSTGPTFSTIHKAKGLESEEVYFLRPDLCPSPRAETAEAKQQERNLAYVAITRAKQKLTYGNIPRR